ncbi:MAG: hypothetical protein ABL986_17770 [Vicinamibacterales bacterium]
MRSLTAGIIMLTLSTPAWAQQPQAMQADQAQARYKIFVMEGVLEKAVQNGAAIVSRQVRSIAPDAMFLTGATQVRGFRLDGLGVFFDVEVPALQPTAAWILRATLVDNGNSLAQLKAFVQKVTDPRDREELQRAIRQLELVMPSNRQVDVQGAARGQVVGQVADRTSAAPPALPPDALLVTDPAAAYTREVKGALIEAMLENSGPLGVSNDEWLVVAARDSEPANRLVPGDAYDTTTWVLRVKGSDLAAFRAGRLTLAEARARVEVREF